MFVLLLKGYRKKDIHSKVEEHLKGLVLKHFDPKRADLIFTEEGSVSQSPSAYIT